MIKLSYWARKNPWTGRISIVLIHVLLCWCGYLLGKNLLALGLQLSSYLLWSALLLYTFGVLFYPAAKKNLDIQEFLTFFARRKKFDWMLAFSTFLVVSFVGNSPGSPFIFSQYLNGATINNTSIGPVPKNAEIKSPFKLTTTRAERKAMFKEFKKVLKESLRKEKGSNNNATRITLVVLTIIGGVFLALLAAGIACSLSCNGNETLAVFVAVFGITGAVFLTLAVVKAIIKKYPRDNSRSIRERRGNEYSPGTTL